MDQTHAGEAEAVPELLQSKLGQAQVINYSFSYINRYQTCPLACRYYSELKLRKRDEGAESHHMVFSRAFHVGLAYLYQSDYQSLPRKERVTAEAIQKFWALYPRQLDQSDLAKTADNGASAMARYVNRWHQEDQRFRVLSVESMDNQEDGFVVKLDLVLQDIETEQIYGVDHKVTGAYLNYDYWQKFEPNSQVVEYVRYIREKWGACDGFIINAVSLRYRQRAYKGEAAGFWTAFERQTFNVNDRQMEADLDSRRYWTDRIEHSKATGLWGMNTSQCKFCEYRDLCKAGWFYPDDAELIDINYRRICGRWFGEPLQPCSLDRDHEGDHGIMQIDPPVEIEVEV